MSSDSNNTNNDDVGVLSPKVNTSPRIHSVGGLMGQYSGRDVLGGDIDNVRESLWMSQYGGDRDLFNALGYIQDPKYEHYRSRYERTDTAPALVDKIPQKAWAQVEVVDPEADNETSDFEQTVNNFLHGDFTKEDPIEVFERATKMERLGQFSLIFVGFNDSNAEPDAAVENVDESQDEDVLAATRALSNEVAVEDLQDQDPEDAIAYLEPYDEGRCGWEDIEWNFRDPTSENFGEPEYYDIDLGDNRPSANVHHTRVIHIAGNVFDDRFRSASVLKQSLNRIDDIEKILGGSSEGYWRSAYQGLVISPPEINGQQTDFSDSGEGLHTQIERYIQNFSREIFTQAEIDPIEVDVSSPADFLDSQYKSLSTGHDLPQSILMGNETGERATEEDRQMFHERAGEFRREYCEPVVLKRFIDRLIEYGVFPEPRGGKNNYRFEWPRFEQRTEQEEWNVAQTKSNALSTGTGGNPMMVVTPEEYREKVLGWKPTRGSEVEVESEVEPVEEEDLELDESDERVQKQFAQSKDMDPEEVQEILEARVNQQYSEGTKVRTDDDLRGFVVDVLTEGFDVDGEQEVNASEEEPVYVVITENSDKPYGYYTNEELEEQDWAADIEDPTSDLKEEEGEDRENVLIKRVKEGLAAAMGRTHQEGHFSWPESWKEADEPARLIALDAWISMGPSGVSSCITEMRGEVVDPGRFCADFADRLYQWDYWRGDSWAPGE